MNWLLTITDRWISASRPVARLFDRLADHVVPHKIARADGCCPSSHPYSCGVENCPWGLGATICAQLPRFCLNGPWVTCGPTC